MSSSRDGVMDGHAIANRLNGVRYCGEIKDKHGEIVGHMFNDDIDCGGSFAVLPDELKVHSVVNALLNVRETFKGA